MPSTSVPGTFIGTRRGSAAPAAHRPCADALAVQNVLRDADLLRAAGVVRTALGERVDEQGLGESLVALVATYGELSATGDEMPVRQLAGAATTLVSPRCVAVY